MFTGITWMTYLSAVTLLLAVYYLYVGVDTFPATSKTCWPEIRNACQGDRYQPQSYRRSQHKNPTTHRYLRTVWMMISGKWNT